MKISRGTVVAPREPAATEMATLSAIEVAPPESLGAYAGDTRWARRCQACRCGHGGHQRNHLCTCRAAAPTRGRTCQRCIPERLDGRAHLCDAGRERQLRGLGAGGHRRAHRCDPGGTHLPGRGQWVELVGAATKRKRDYGVINEEPSAGELMSECGWSDEPSPPRTNGTDETVAREICAEVSGDGLACGIAVQLDRATRRRGSCSVRSSARSLPRSYANWSSTPNSAAAAPVRC